MNRQQRRIAMKQMKKQELNEIKKKYPLLNDVEAEYVRQSYSASFYDNIDYMLDTWPIVRKCEKFIIDHYIQNHKQYSYKELKSITPRIEISRNMYESYNISVMQDFVDKLVSEKGFYFDLCIPPYQHGVLRMDDGLWREWFISNMTDISYDLHIDTYILTSDLYDESKFIGVNDERIIKMYNDCPVYLILTFVLQIRVFYDGDGKGCHFEWVQDACWTYDDILKKMFLHDAQIINPFAKSIYKKVIDYVNDYELHGYEKCERLAKQIVEVFFDVIRSFNYAALINKPVVKKVERCGSIQYVCDLSNDVESVSRQMSLGVENQIKVKCSNKVDVEKLQKSDVSHHLKPIIWQRKSHLRTYKNGKTVWVKAANHCHWRKFDNVDNVLLKELSTIVCFSDLINSSLEKYSIDYLDLHKIEYISQYTFNDLLGDNDVLRFDFGIKKNDEFSIFIECQGEQHYHPVDMFGGQVAFERQQRYDNKKIEYCKQHSYKLLLMDGRLVKTEFDVIKWFDDNLIPLL